jgi:hypothetical protein
MLFKFPKRFQAPAPLLLTANVHQVEMFTEQIGQLRPVQLGMSSQHLTDAIDAGRLRQHTFDLVLSFHAVTVDGFLNMSSIS